MTFKINKSDEEWQAQLTPEQYAVCRKKGTEPAFTGQYHACKTQGVYRCAGCGAELFDSTTKYDSDTGWPSFWSPSNEDNIATETDNSWFMRRVEVHCSQCGCHLGHVFEDGPPPTGLRYCINSASLALESRE